MFVKKLVSEGLAHFSYIAGNNGEAFVVDPGIDVDPYIKIAEDNCCSICFVFETHRHEDFLIGSLKLEDRTGCSIIHSNRLDFKYGKSSNENETFDVGGMRIKVIETPGHSPESLSFVLYLSSENIPFCVFTGDALFYGNTGRVDLLGADNIADNAALLYDSIHKKLLMLEDGTVVYPAHGEGSACGGTMSDIEISTIGYERAANPILMLGRREFIERKKKEKIPLPPYFERMAYHNLNGPALSIFDRIKPLDVPSFSKFIENSIVVDTRSPLSFAGGHIRGSYNIWLDGLPVFAGWIVDYHRNVLLVMERQEDVEIAKRYLERVGIDKVRGYLCEGIDAWHNQEMALEQIGVLFADDLYKKLKDNDLFVLDVREEDEYAEGHIPGAVNIFVGELEKRLAAVPSDRPVVTVCSSGNRSGLGASILARRGCRRIYNFIGGMKAWNLRDYPIE